MASSQSEPQSEEMLEEPRCRFKVSINLLCVIGAALGVSAFFMPWIWSEWGLMQSEGMFLEILHSSGSTSTWPIALIVFMIGTILAFASPVASFIQVAGLCGFYHFFNQTSSVSGFTNGFSIGFAVAILSAALVLASLLRPVGPGCGDAESRRRLRYKVIHLMPWQSSEDSQSPHHEGGHGPGRGGREKKWFVVLTVAISIILLAVVASFAVHEPREQLFEVDGGVMLVLGQNGMITPYGSWNGSQLSLANDAAEVSWVLQNSSWELEPFAGWNSVAFGAMNLSGVLVTPTIVDWTHPGIVSPGDLIVLTAESTLQPYASFTEGTKYTLLLNTSWLLDKLYMIDRSHPLPRGYEVSFEFRDGDLSYECHAVDSQGDPVDVQRSPDYDVIVPIAVVSMPIVAASWYLSYAQAARKHRKAR